jgi:ABC-type multidrug transport system fused ATPase/permease subunit
MMTINPLYTIIYFTVFPFFIWLQFKISAPIQSKARVMSQEMAGFNAVVNDCLQNTSLITAYSLENIVENRYLSAYDNYYTALKKYINSLLKLVISGTLATMTPFVFINVAAGYSVINGGMTVASFIAFTAVASTAGDWLNWLSQRLGTFKASQAGAVRLNENVSENIEDIYSGSEIIESQSDEIAVNFEDVSFSYGDKDSLALDSVSFKIRKNERVAIVGGSGSGKSTVLKLLLGLYEPLSGNISVSGRHISGISKTDLRSHLAYVPQDSFLFPYSIRQNVTCQNGALNNTEESKMIQACINAGILDFVNELPDRFDTVLSESSENISGGQKQRIALARAFYKDSPVLLLDEATSALDTVTENGVLDVINTLIEGRTVIMVAHRLKAILACENIIVMENGRITGTGTHKELLKNNKTYTAFYESQLDDEIGDE